MVKATESQNTECSFTRLLKQHTNNCLLPNANFTISSQFHEELTISRRAHNFTKSSQFHEQLAISRAACNFTNSSQFHQQLTISRTPHNFTNSSQFHEQLTISPTDHNFTNSSQFHQQLTISRTAHNFTNSSQFHEQSPICFTSAHSFSPVLRLMLWWTCCLRAVTVQLLYHCFCAPSRNARNLASYWAVSNIGYDSVCIVSTVSVLRRVYNVSGETLILGCSMS